MTNKKADKPVKTTKPVKPIKTTKSAKPTKQKDSITTTNPQDNPRPDYYHDPVRLLKTYRDVRWNLKLSEEHHRMDFEAEYGMSITEYLDNVYAAGIEFAGTKLEHHANSMKRTMEMLKLIDTAVYIIRENYSEGEPYYWILYYTYLSPQKLKSIGETIERIQHHAPHITRDNYYKHRKKAVNTLSSVLWGFTAKSEIDVLDAFIADVVNATEPKQSKQPKGGA